MIEIIKHGTKKKIHCNNCGCVFSYEQEDIECELFGSPLHEERKECVKCPQCKEYIVLENDVRLR